MIYEYIYDSTQRVHQRRQPTKSFRLRRITTKKIGTSLQRAPKEIYTNRLPVSNVRTQKKINTHTHTNNELRGFPGHRSLVINTAPAHKTINRTCVARVFRGATGRAPVIRDPTLESFPQWAPSCQKIYKGGTRATRPAGGASRLTSHCVSLCVSRRDEDALAARHHLRGLLALLCARAPPRPKSSRPRPHLTEPSRALPACSRSRCPTEPNVDQSSLRNRHAAPSCAPQLFMGRVVSEPALVMYAPEG